jgi:uncharacterized membrane protein required for colicin V production
MNGISITIDVVILAVCSIVIIKSIKAGFIKSVMGLLKGIVSFLAAYAFTVPLGNFIKEKFILGALSGNISETIRSLTNGKEGVDGVLHLFSEMPDALNQIMGRYGANAGDVGKAIEGLPGRDAAIGTASDFIANPVAVTISNCLAFLLIFLTVFAVLSLLTVILDAVFHLPVLHGVNKAFGVAFGILEALIFAWVISYVAASAMRALGSVDPSVFGEQVVEKSLIMRLFLSFNLLGVIGNVLH